jgi:hypothetical protein
MSDIYCYGEPGTFPETEFRRDDKGRLKVPHIHETGTPHYVTGAPVNPPNIPGLLIIRSLAAQVHRIALTLSEDELGDLIAHVQSIRKDPSNL